MPTTTAQDLRQPQSDSFSMEELSTSCSWGAILICVVFCAAVVGDSVLLPLKQLLVSRYLH
jgi:hypothetical protein